MFSRFRRVGGRERRPDPSAHAGDLVGRVSHELRTPLGAIIGFAELLEDDSPSPSQRECIEQILSAARHMVAMTEQLLEGSSARVHTDAPVPVSELAAGAVRLCGPLAAAHQIDLRLAPAPPALWALGDDRAITRVLLNLISNAIKYNRPGGSVMVRLHASAGQARVEVGDTGIGIEPELIGRLFRPFERLDAPARGIEGAGLGLALSRTLVEQMAGTIGARSEPGRGSTFWLSLRSAPGQVVDLERAARGVILV